MCSLQDIFWRPLPISALIAQTFLFSFFPCSSFSQFYQDCGYLGIIRSTCSVRYGFCNCFHKLSPPLARDLYEMLFWRCNDLPLIDFYVSPIGSLKPKGTVKPGFLRTVALMVPPARAIARSYPTMNSVRERHTQHEFVELFNVFYRLSVITRAFEPSALSWSFIIQPPLSDEQRSPGSLITLSDPIV